MKDNISKRDWETISAYLDGQLSERKQTRLTSRLEQEPQLSIALDELRNTRQVLRSSPQLRAPRSFMLTPEMAGQPRRLPRLAPVFGWASAVASFFFVLFLVGDLFSAGGAIPMALNNIPTQEEFVAPRRQVVKDDAMAQPATNLGGMEEPSAESAQVAAQPEISEGELRPAAVATPQIESAPKEELEPISKAIDMVPTAEASSEVADVQPGAEFTDETMDAGVTFSADPETEIVGDDPQGAQKVAEESAEDANEFVEVASITETMAVESAPEQHLLAPPVVEEAKPEEEEQPAQEMPPPTENIAPPPAARALPTETQSAPQPTLTSEIVNTENTEISLKDVATEEQTADALIGVEVILGLVALGTGLAWVYLRRRGG